MILFIKHIDIEGPGTIGHFLKSNKIEFKIIDLAAGDALPETFIELDAVVSLGGPMNVYEENKYPFLKKENVFIQNLINLNIPFMGICLGAQLLAKASGGNVIQSPEKEIGFYDIILTKEGLKDPLFQEVSQILDVYHWHEDMFNIPPSGILLASSRGCPHQAFKVGRCAYGLQFHIEITDASIRGWVDKYIKKYDEGEELKEKMLAHFYRNEQKFNASAEIIYRNFFKEVCQCV